MNLYYYIHTHGSTSLAVAAVASEGRELAPSFGIHDAYETSIAVRLPFPSGPPLLVRGRQLGMVRPLFVVNSACNASLPTIAAAMRSTRRRALALTG
jgi:hypothetical protein